MKSSEHFSWLLAVVSGLDYNEAHFWPFSPGSGGGIRTLDARIVSWKFYHRATGAQPNKVIIGNNQI
jgi:hypothetical protein